MGTFQLLLLLCGLGSVVTFQRSLCDIFNVFNEYQISSLPGGESVGWSHETSDGHLDTAMDTRIGIRTNKFLNRLEIIKEIKGKWLKIESEVRIKKHFLSSHRP